jgi:hypothetical protein
MATETHIIKSLYIQNAIMLSFLGVVVSFLIHSLLKKRPKHFVVFCVWLFIVVWFFNSPFFGFSAVAVSPEGIKLNYGVLSFRNDRLPIDSEWEILSHMSGIRRNKKLYYISIGDRESMKVRGTKNLRLLEKIGESIEGMKKRTMK